MSWRIVSISSMSKLDYKMDYLIVRKREETKRIHLSEISILILESTAISLTAYLLRELERRKIDVIFCDEKRTPYGMLSSLYGSHDTALRYREQAAWSKAREDQIWGMIVRQKLRGQIAVLPPSRQREKDLLENYVSQVLPGDPRNREAHGAKVYFNALFGMDFVRDGDDAVNSALNYGYGLLLSATAREITAYGFCTQLGIFHENRFNRLNLACDLMEPFRPFIDAKVRDLSPEKFEREEKLEMVGVLNSQLRMEGNNVFFLNALRSCVHSILDALGNDSVDRLRFPDYEEL